MTENAPFVPQALAAIDIFRGLSAVALTAAAAVVYVRRLPRNTRVFNQGDVGARAHAVLEGAVRIAQTGSDGAQVVIRFIGPGETFGAVAIFVDGHYPADAITISETVEVSWREAELLELMRQHPQIAINAIRTIGKRLQEVQERVRELATQSAERRIAHAVLRLAQQAGHSTIGGTTIEFPLRRKDIADISGTTLHTASRILTAWEKEGLLVSHNRHLTIQSPSEILRIAEDGGH